MLKEKKTFKKERTSMTKQRKVQSSLRFERLETRTLLSATTPTYSDPEIRSFMSEAMKDYKLDRQDVIDVFRLAGDGNSVSQEEWLDLRNITTSTLNISMQDRYLAKNIFAGLANKGRDLKVGSSTAELNRLIDKHFLGKDYPKKSTNASYMPVSGQLFVNGPSSADVDQGNLGNCYLVASFAAIADKDPQQIIDRFIDNGDGTWTVSFFSTNSRLTKDQHFVVVDNMLPVSRSGRAYYASFGSTWNNPSNELWVGLMEKAYVQWNETGLTRQGNTLNAYSAIAGGGTHVVFNQLYHYQASFVKRITRNLASHESTLINAVNDGVPVSISRYTNTARTSSHAYSVSSYSNGKFFLYNPWGHSHLRMTYQELIKAGMRGFSLGPNKKDIITIGILPITVPARPVYSGVIMVATASIWSTNTIKK